MRKRKSIAVLAVTVAVLAACQTAANTQAVRFRPVATGVAYPDQPINAGGEDMLRFTAEADGVHTIALTGLNADLSWELYDHSIFAWDLADRWRIAVSDSSGTADEVGQTPPLTAGQEYYLVIFEWDENTAARYSLIIHAP